MPDLAVGRLVETPGEIISTIDHFLDPDHGPTLPTPQASLVTGYDFLADAAHRVNEQFDEALPGDTSDTLIAENGTAPADSWSSDDLRDKLFGETHYDLVYLAGHFSANDTLAADFDDTNTFEADEIDPTVHPGVFTDTIVLSAGCHSGYNIVDDAAIDGETNPNDWAQRMAQQHAVLIGGTGYQYGDTDFLEYSERLYLDIARRLRQGPADRGHPGGGRPGPDAGQAGLPRQPDHARRHRPEGPPPGDPLRPAHDRLRRARAGSGGGRRDARPPDSHHHWTRRVPWR